MKHPSLALLAVSLLAAPATTLPGAANALPRLIVRSDDMGTSHAANQAVIEAHINGVESCAEVMAPAPWFIEAAKLLATQSKLDVGVQLTLTSEWENLKWRPLTNCPSLVDADGYFFPTIQPNPKYPGHALLQKSWDIAEVEREFRAQIELVRKYVPRVSHITGHMGCTTITEGVKDVVKRLSQEYHLDIDPAAMDVRYVTYAGPRRTAAEKTASFIAMLEKLEPGHTYLFVDRPAMDSPESRAIFHLGGDDVATDRQSVLTTLTDPQVKTVVHEHAIQLIGYRDLAP